MKPHSLIALDSAPPVACLRSVSLCFVLLCLVSLGLGSLCFGCSGDSGGQLPTADARPTSGDAHIIDSGDGDAGESACPAMANALLGRCKLAGSDDNCWGTPGEDRVFVPLANGDSIRAVNGPQGALMIVLAARTTGIYPGDPNDPASPDNATVDIALFDSTGTEFARYRGRPIFEPSPTDPGQLDAPGLFVIVDNVNDGTPVTAALEIEDRDGLRRCGELYFIATR